MVLTSCSARPENRGMLFSNASVDTPASPLANAHPVRGPDCGPSSTSCQAGSHSHAVQCDCTAAEILPRFCGKGKGSGSQFAATRGRVDAVRGLVPVGKRRTACLPGNANRGKMCSGIHRGENP